MGIDFNQIEKYIELINKVDRDKLHMLIEAAYTWLDKEGEKYKCSLDMDELRAFIREEIRNQINEVLGK